MNPTLFWSFRLSPVAVSMAETGIAHSMTFRNDCIFDVCMGAGEAQRGTVRWLACVPLGSGRVTPKDSKISKHLIVKSIRIMLRESYGKPKTDFDLYTKFIHLHTHLSRWNFYLTSATELSVIPWDRWPLNWLPNCWHPPKKSCEAAGDHARISSTP